MCFISGKQVLNESDVIYIMQINGNVQYLYNTKHKENKLSECEYSTISMCESNFILWYI